MVERAGEAQHGLCLSITTKRKRQEAAIKRGIEEGLAQDQEIRWARCWSRSLYTLRHNFASQLIMAGVDLMTVSQLMGHTSIETTIKHYGHLRQQHIEEALELVEKKQGRPRISQS